MLRIVGIVLRICTGYVDLPRIAVQVRFPPPPPICIGATHCCSMGCADFVLAHSYPGTPLVHFLAGRGPSRSGFWRSRAGWRAQTRRCLNGARERRVASLANRDIPHPYWRPPQERLAPIPDRSSAISQVWLSGNVLRAPRTRGLGGPAQLSWGPARRRVRDEKREFVASLPEAPEHNGLEGS